MSQIIFLLVLAIIPVYGIFEVSTYNVTTLDDPVGPSGFPMVICIFILIMISIQIIRIIRKDTNTEAQFISLFKGTPGSVLLFLIGYIVAIKYLGFVISTSVFTVAIRAFLNQQKTHQRENIKSLVMNSIIMIAFSIGMFYLFKGLVHITLPLPIWY
jgi:hypothetical protein